MADVREILLKLLGRETISTAAKKASDGLDGLGDSAEDAAKDAKKLDRQLAETEKQIADVVKALAADPGDIGLRKQLAALRRESRTLQGIRKQFEGLGDDGAKGFAARFSARIGPLIASAPISPPIIAAAAAVSPGIAALVSAGIAGGAAVGAVAIGTKLAATRNEVGREWSTLGGDIMEGLVVDAKPMAEPLIEAAGIVREEWQSLRPEFQALFESAARSVEPLTRGAAGFAREAIPGLREAAREGENIARVLEYQLPRAGRATTNMLNAITEDSENAGAALSLAFTGAEISMQTFGNSVGLLNKALPFAAGHLMLINEKLTENDRKSAEAAAAAEKQSQAESRRAQAVARSTEEIQGMNAALKEAPGEALSAEQAMLGFEQAIVDANEVIKENGKATNENSQKYRDNMGALLDMASASQTAAAAAAEQSGSQESANQVLDRGRSAFLAAAKAAGVNAREAQNLANKLFGIPGQRTTKINVNKQQAEKDLASINAKANHAARTRNLRILATYTRPDQSGALGAVGQLAGGGPMKKGLPYLVGEEGPELVTPTENGYVHTAAQTRRMTGSGTVVGGSHMTVGFAAGSDLERAILRMIRFTVETNGGTGKVLGIR